MNSQIEFLKDKCKSDFGVLKKWTNTSVLSDCEAIENLQSLISRKFKILLDNDFNSSLNVLYRTDISEDKVKKVFDENLDSADIANELSKLYLERLAEKWKTRLKFSSDEEGDW